MDYKIIVVTMCFILADIITGVLQALFNGSWSSTKMRLGLCHKVSELLIIAVGAGVEIASPIIGLGVEIPLVKGICAMLCVMELGSVLENLGNMNPELAGLLSKYFDKFIHNKEGE